MRGTGASTAWSRTVMQQGQLRQAVTQPRQPTHTWRDQQDTWNNRQAQRSHDPRIRLSGGCRTRPTVSLLRRDEARGYQLLIQVQRKPSATDGYTEDSQGWDMGIAASVTRPDLPGDTGTDQFNQESRARANAAPRVTAGCAEEGTDAARLKEVAQGASLPKGGSSNDAAFGRCTRWYTSEPRSRVAIKDNRVVRKTIGRSLRRLLQKRATSNCDAYDRNCRQEMIPRHEYQIQRHIRASRRVWSVCRLFG